MRYNSNPRSSIYAALDSLIGFGDQGWIGNADGIRREVKRQGRYTTNYMIQKIQKEDGRRVGIGQYQFMRDMFEVNNG